MATDSFFEGRLPTVALEPAKSFVWVIPRATQDHAQPVRRLPRHRAALRACVRPFAEAVEIVPDLLAVTFGRHQPA